MAQAMTTDWAATSYYTCLLLVSSMICQILFAEESSSLDLGPPVECVTAYALHGTVIFLGPHTKLAYKYWRDRRRADVFPNFTKMRSTTVFLVTIVLIAMVELSETRGRLEVLEVPEPIERE